MSMCIICTSPTQTNARTALLAPPSVSSAEVYVRPVPLPLRCLHAMQGPHTAALRMPELTPGSVPKLPSGAVVHFLK